MKRRGAGAGYTLPPPFSLLFRSLRPEGDYLQQLRHLPDDIIFEKCRDDIKKLFPKAREAVIRKWVLVRQRQNVYKPTPGMESHRPFQRSPYPNFYLTGDWTKTHVSSGGMEATIGLQRGHGHYAVANPVHADDQDFPVAGGCFT